jgi:hypothetical protein
VKLLLARMASNMLCRREIPKLVVESDCASLITKLGKLENDMSRTLSIISDIQRLCSWFKDIKFTKIRREDNRVTHELARYSRVEDVMGCC